MKNKRLPFTAISLAIMVCPFLLISFSGAVKPVRAVAGMQKCLIVSDMHFSPIYGSTEKDTTLKRRLENESFDQWIAYFEKTPAQMKLDTSLLLKDSNYALLRSAMANMKRRLPHPAFIVIAGDFIWHGATPADSMLKKRTIQFITQLYKEYFPGTLIIPAMGNNDTYGQDYDLQNSKFLKDFATAWEPNLPSNSADSLKKNGYYTCSTGNLEFIVINSASLNAGTNYPQGGVMLKWLKSTLENSNGKNIWIITHIPPGLNSYNGKSFWKNDYTNEWLNQVVKNAASVRVTICSHTHFDDFKVIYDNSPKVNPVSFVRIVPSVCPNHGNYPSFEVAEINGTDQLVNETSWYLNLSTAQQGVSPEKVIWADSVNIKKSFDLKNITAASLSQAIDHIKSDTGGQAIKSYANFYSLGSIAGPVFINKGTYLKYLKADSLKEK